MAAGEIKGEEREKPFCFNDLACYVFFSFPFFHPRVIFTHFVKKRGYKEKKNSAHVSEIYSFSPFFLFYLLCFSAVGLFYYSLLEHLPESFSQPLSKKRKII